MNKTQSFTVIFLVDQTPPYNILLLKRANSKAFAPGYYTGIGGKVGDQPEFANETIIEGAYRELKEETLDELTIDNTPLLEFARFKYENGITLYYFIGIFSHYPQTPSISPTDGSLEWVKVSELLHYDIIPTTKIVCEYWNQNQYQLTPFTVHGKEVGVKKSVRIVEVLDVSQGLH